MTGVLFRAGSVGMVVAVVTALWNAVVGWSHVDPVSVWLLFSGSYALGATEPATWRA